MSNVEKCEHFGKHCLSGFDHCQMFFSALILEKRGPWVDHETCKLPPPVGHYRKPAGLVKTPPSPPTVIAEPLLS